MEILESIWNCIQENANLVVSIVAAFFAAAAFFYSIYSNHLHKKERLNDLEDELDSINSLYFNQITKHIGFPETMQMEARKKTIERQIRRLKKK